jgi:hypothetical protein
MKFMFHSLVALLLLAPCLMAGTDDTTVFRAQMLPANETPPVSLAGASASAVITVRVTRDARGIINAATVIFDVDYTMPQSATFVGLHIHNGAAGVSGPVVISSGLTGTNTLTGTSGHVTRTVNYTSSDTAGLNYVSGLLGNPDLYYVNMHTQVNPGGVFRGQLLRMTANFRPAMDPANEAPAVAGLDASGAALIRVSVNRDTTGTITSGVVAFDITYRFPGSVTIVGLHIHSAPAGVSGPVVISSGITSANSIANASGRGNLFRVAEIPGTDTAGIAALTGLMADPTGYYVNIHTTVNPGGAMRGQLDHNSISFLSFMDPAQEVPAVASSGSAVGLTTIKVTRDGAGNIASGTVTFNVAYNFPGGPITLVGLHIHSAKTGVNGPVLISSGLAGGDNSVSSDTGVGTILRQVGVTSETASALAAVVGVFASPELYYINVHSTVNPGGVARSQLALETYHFHPTLSTANELPPPSATASASGWITISVIRDASGNITSGNTLFDMDCNMGGAATIVAMHIHRGTSSVNGPVVIGSGIPSTESTSGILNLTAVANSAAADTTALSAISDLIVNPAGFYVNIHTTTSPGGFVRSQLLHTVNFIPQCAGGSGWISSVIVSNPSATSSAQGLLEFLDVNGNPTPSHVIDSTVSFWLPPSGTAVVNTSNFGDLSVGNVRVHANSSVSPSVRYLYPGLETSGAATPVVATVASIPVSIGNGGVQNTGIALLGIDSSLPTLVLTLRDATGAVVPGGIRTLTLAVGQQLVGYVSDLLQLPNLTQFTGTLTVELHKGPFYDGVVSVIGLQFDQASLTPAAIQVIQ